MSGVKRWFNDKLLFKCTGCGKCCHTQGKGKVYVNTNEISKIASFLGINESEFRQKHVHTIADSSGLVINESQDKKCPFLKENRCSIYKVRPTQCRTYPFWPQYLIGEAEWRAESSRCEGMGVKNTSTQCVNNTVKVGPNAQYQALDLCKNEEIALNMIVHQVYNRGQGEENWTYDEATELLKESIEQDPTLEEEFLDEFFSLNESKLVYEDSRIRVVDAKAPVPSLDEPQLSDGLFSTVSALANERGSLHYYTRRIEFKASSQFSQTEMYLQMNEDEWRTHIASDSDVRFRYNALVMPIHRIIANISMEYLMGRIGDLQYMHEQQLSTSSSSMPLPHMLRVAVVGAGCCALPMYFATSPTLVDRVHIDLVEPAKEMLESATRHFGVNFGSALEAHCTDGLTYLHTVHNSAQRLDYIIIDAFGEDTVIGDQSVSFAPPLSLIEGGLPLMYTVLCKENSLDKSTGLLAIHIYGSNAWQRKICQVVETFGRFCKPQLYYMTKNGKKPLEEESSHRVLLTMPAQAQVEFNQLVDRLNQRDLSIG